MNALTNSAQRKPDKPDRRAIADWTLDRLHEMVFSGEIRVGDTLSEVELTQRLGVSRSPVRDALKELEHAGLFDVDVVNGRRTLRPFEIDDVSESYDLRIALESLAAQCAARRDDELGIAALESALDSMRRGLDSASEEWLTLDLVFHRQLAAASAARRVSYLLSGIWIQHHAFLRRLDRVGTYPPTVGGRKDVIREHEKILEKVAARDAPGAAQAVSEHLETRRAAVLGALSRAGRVTL